MHARFFVLATFDETALILKPVGDTEGDSWSVRRRGAGDERGTDL